MLIGLANSAIAARKAEGVSNNTAVCDREHSSNRCKAWVTSSGLVRVPGVVLKGSRF